MAATTRRAHIDRLFLVRNVGIDLCPHASSQWHVTTVVGGRSSARGVGVFPYYRSVVVERVGFFLKFWRNVPNARNNWRE